MTNKKKLVIISGLSGSGKTIAAATFEDMGFYCISNMPPALIPEIINSWGEGEERNVAVIVDARINKFFNPHMSMFQKLEEIRSEAYTKPILLYLDTGDDDLIRRFKETRRKHPLVDKSTGIYDAIKKERELTADMRDNADVVIDTTGLEPESLRRTLRELFAEEAKENGLLISIVSFGFKHGVPQDADIVFDVRFLDNPYWVPELREMNGTDPVIRDFVFNDPLTEPLMEKLTDLIEFTAPQYAKEGKAYLTIAIGCTGGHHRSVVIAGALADILRRENLNVRLEHRELR